MSWDIFVEDIPESARCVADIPEDYKPRRLGRRSDIIRGILEVAPSADFTDPSWGKIDDPNLLIDINIGPEEDVTGFAFHVYGGELAAFVIADILDHLGLKALDPASDSGIFGVGCDVTSGLRRWRAYRDQVVNGRRSWWSRIFFSMRR